MVLDAFLLKKIVSLLIHLIPGVPIFMLLALLSRRWTPRLSRFCLWFGTLVLLLFSSPLVSNALVSSLENRYPPLQQAPADTQVILVLGSGHRYKPDRPANSALTATSLSRVTEGVRLWKTLTEATLVTSGASSSTKTTSAEVAAMLALSFGVPEARIHRLNTTRDTATEIRLGVELVQESGQAHAGRLVIVSSASHLARAEQLVISYGISYTLAPSDFLESRVPWWRLGSSHLLNADRAMHEYIGMLWHWASEN